MNELERILVGQTESHVDAFLGGVLVHRDAIVGLVDLKTRAEKDGIQLALASGFRGFEAQLRIWNAKCLGKRALVDKNGKDLDFASLTDEQIVDAILRWSALPGASRHHWGTDFDVFDVAALPAGQALQLVPQEAAPGGPFEKFSLWLDENLEDAGFFRPYQKDLGGVSPEWWHISYAPLSEKFLDEYSLPLLERVIAAAEMEKKTIVQRRLPEIYKKYVTNIVRPS